MARFEKTFCSSCGGEFGPGDSGYSHCDDHGGRSMHTEEREKYEEIKIAEELEKYQEIARNIAATRELTIAIYRTALEEIANNNTADTHRIRAIARAALATKRK